MTFYVLVLSSLRYPGQGNDSNVMRKRYLSRLDFRLQNILSLSYIAPFAKYQKLKYISLASGNFPGIFECRIFLGLECTINLQNLKKIVKAILEFLPTAQEVRDSNSGVLDQHEE